MRCTSLIVSLIHTATVWNCCRQSVRLKLKIKLEKQCFARLLLATTVKWWSSQTSHHVLKISQFAVQLSWLHEFIQVRAMLLLLCMECWFIWFQMTQGLSISEAISCLKSYQCWIQMESLMEITDALWAARISIDSGYVPVLRTNQRIIPVNKWCARHWRAEISSSFAIFMDIRDARTYLCMGVLIRELTDWKNASSLICFIKIQLISHLTIAVSKYRRQRSQLRE